ncbi:MAG: fused MFS/spermidine synthase [bacterium]
MSTAPLATDREPSAAPDAGRVPRAILILFFLSGAAGLIYQVVWTRMLTLVFGASVLAISTVLTVFMAGLAAGSYYFGRRADRPGADLLKLYGRLEIGVALFCAATPALITLVRRIYAAAAPSFEGDFMTFSLIRFALCALVLAVPTFLMGGTLPILAKFVVRRFDTLGEGVGVLYAVNTAGAVIGSFATGYILIATVGVRATIVLAVLVNIVVGLVALRMSARGSVPALNGDPDEGTDEARRAATAASGSSSASGTPFAAAPASALLRMGALVLLLVSGISSLIYEVAWSRLLSQVLGSSVYAFSAMLTTFLTGIALGSMIVTRRADRTKNPIALLALLEIGIGVCAFVATPLLDQLPLLFVRFAGVFGTGFVPAAIINFLFAALVMIVPTLLMGATLPVAARIYAKDLRHVGSAIGVVYSWNTVGAIIGAFLGGFWAIASLGMQKTILFAAALNIIAGSLYILISPRTRIVTRILAPAVALGGLVLLAVFGGDWDRYLLNLGAFDSPGYWQEQFKKQGLKEVIYSYDMRYYQEGLTSNVAVSQEGENLFLQINGRTEASTTSDMQNQLLAAHIPLLLHERPRNTCLIGLGSGITLGSMLIHPVSQVDCVEISAEVVEAAGYFSEIHYNALADPRVRIIQDDGRNVLLANDRKYDVIISEPSKPWITGVSNLFTREYYKTVASRLEQGGIVCQWCHYYSMSPEDFKTIVRTFSSVFPYVQLWNVGRDVFLIGTKTALMIDTDLMQKKLLDQKVSFDLARVGIRDPYELTRLFMLGDTDLREYVGAGAINTDDRPVIEFSAPKNLSVYKQEEIYSSMLLFRPRFVAYPLTRQITELANARGYAFPLASLQYLTPATKLTPRVAGMVRTTLPEPDPATGAAVVSYRREAFFETDDGGALAFAAIERVETSEGALDSTLVKVPGVPVEYGDHVVREHKARWVITHGPDPEELLVAMTWHCMQSRAQFLVTRKYRGSANTARILDEVKVSAYCLHGRIDPS